MYSYRPGAFTDADETAGRPAAGLPRGGRLLQRPYARPAAASPRTRHTIGEAMGILMGGHRLDEDQAFAALRRYAQDRNVTLRDVAAQVCERGGLPE